MIAGSHYMWSIYGSETAVSETAVSQLQNRCKYRICTLSFNLNSGPFCTFFEVNKIMRICDLQIANSNSIIIENYEIVTPILIVS